MKDKKATPGKDVSRYSRKKLEQYYRWTCESLESFRAKFGASSNAEALDAIDDLKATVKRYRERQQQPRPEVAGSLDKKLTYLLDHAYNVPKGWREEI